MKLKMTEDGKGAVVQDGKPVYLHDDGRELPFDAAATVTERDKLQGELHAEKIGGAFSRSKFIADKLAIPTDLVEARFGKNFELKDGKVVAKDAAGNPIYSGANPGELAGLDEALEMLVNAYPQREHILKGNGGAGSRPRPNMTANAGGPKTMKRADFDKLHPLARSAAVLNDKVTIVD